MREVPSLFAALRRYEAAGWLRKMVGVVAGKDLPAEPSEEGFRLGLRNGIILCNVLNKINAGAITKVVEASADSGLLPDAAALSAYQYFENIRNFLNAVQEIGLPTFEASDLEQGGKGERVVNCVLALKSYSDWKLTGGNGSWKYLGSLKSVGSAKNFVRKNTEPFGKPLSRAASLNDNLLDGLPVEQSSNEDFPQASSEMISSGHLGTLVRSVLSDKKPEEVPMLIETIGTHTIGTSPSPLSILSMSVLGTLVRSVLSDKKPEEVPMLIETMLQKVIEEFEHRLTSQNELVKDDDKQLDMFHRENDLETAEGSAEMKVKDDHKHPDMFHGESAFETDEGSAEMKVKDDYKHLDTVNEEKSLEKAEESFEVKVKSGDKHLDMFNGEKSLEKAEEIIEIKMESEEEDSTQVENKGHFEGNSTEDEELQLRTEDEELKRHILKQRGLFDQQKRNIEELKHTLRTMKAGMQFIQMKYSEEFSILGRHLNGIAQAASGYHKVLEDNRKLYNQIQDLKEEVFIDTQPLIRSVLDGYNVCIFAYGQTGSGKTYTMTGPEELTEQGLGVNYRALNDLFILAKQRRDAICYDVAVQMMEIYNEQVRDLLGLNVPDANLIPVTSTADVIELMNTGHRNRAVSATAMNDRSSRSHSCLTVHVQGRDVISGGTVRGSLHLVDLAGSERVDKSEVKGDRLKEAQHINKSLAALGDVIAALAQKNSHVPYRNSKLTQLLQDSLGGRAKTLMFVHISPEMEAVGETISTLKFAERVATIELGAARVNKESGDARELKEQIANLKAALARKDEESDNIQNETFIPEIQTTKVELSSPVYSQDGGKMSAGHINDRQSEENAGETELESNIGLRRNGSSFDFQYSLLPIDSPSSPSPKLYFQEGEDAELISGDWVDKTTTVNRQEENKGCVNTNKQLEGPGNSGSLPELFYQKFCPSVIGSKKESREYEMAATDDSDEQEMATSDSSEADMHWQSQIPRTTSVESLSQIPRAMSVESTTVSKIKKPQSKPGKRTAIRSPSPSQSLKFQNGSGKSPNQTPQRHGRPPSVDRKRSSSVGKTGSMK
ncbi:hypothetical protein ACLOJK_017708 [Asimina triloba]